MSRLSALPLVFLALAACADTPVAPDADLAPQFAATVNHSESKVPVGSFGVFVPCANDGAGELVVASDVSLHFVNRFNIDARGGVHMSSHAQPIGNWDGIGQVTGDVYQATGVTRSSQNWDGNVGFPLSYTYVNNFRWIGPGPGNNYTVHSVFHVTINANGETTAQINKSWVDCK